MKYISKLWKTQDTIETTKSQQPFIIQNCNEIYKNAVFIIHSKYSELFTGEAIHCAKCEYMYS